MSKVFQSYTHISQRKIKLIRKEGVAKEDEVVKMVIIPHDPSHSQRVHWPQSLRHRQPPRPNPHHRVSPRQRWPHHHHHHQQVGLQKTPCYHREEANSGHP
ncbi:hypothetical protein ACSBR1_020896 [Camellia fascicularis]